MRYIAHVIDDASQHEKQEDGSYHIIPGITDDNTVCDIVRTDVWYTVEAESTMDAIAIIANTIEVKKGNGETCLLTEAITETHKENTTTDFSNDDSKSKIDDTFIKIVTNSNSEYYLAMCQIPMKKNDQEWIEFHKVHFYLSEDKKLVEI